MTNGNYYLNEDIGDSGVAQTQNPSFISKDSNPFRYKPHSTNLGAYTDASSKYDEFSGNIISELESGRTIEDVRAESQTTGDIWLNAGINGLVTMGTTALSGTVGLATGILEAAVTGDFNKVWDNNVNNWVTDVQNKTRENFNIYRGQEYEDKSNLEKLGTGIFWAELVQNAIGYGGGMMIPGVGYSKMVSALPKAARALIPAFLSSMSEASIEAINSKNEEVQYKSQVARDTYAELSNSIFGEDKAKLEQEYYNTLQEIEEDAIKAGNFVYGANVAALTASNALQFGRLFSGGFDTAERIAKSTGGSKIKQTLEGLYETESMKTATMKALGKKLFIDAPSEGLEEAVQGIISETPSLASDYNRFNESKFNPNKEDLPNDIISALGVSISNALGDKQTGEEFLMGYFTSILGIPTFANKKLSLSGNIISETIEARQENVKNQKFVNDVNNRLQNNETMKAYYNGLQRHTSLQEDMNSFLDSDDAFNYKTAESAQLISDVIMFDNVGGINRLKEIINNSIDMSDEGIQALIEETTKDGEGPFVVDGNSLSIEEVRTKIQERQNTINSTIDNYLKDKEMLSRNKILLSEESMESALFLSSQQRNFNDRLHSIVDEAYFGVEKLYNEYLEKNPNAEIPRLNKSTFYSDVLTNQNFLDFISNRLNDSGSVMSYSERQSLSQKLQDISKLDIAVSNYGKRLQDVLTNPIKEDSKIEDNKQKAENKKNVRKNLDLQNNIDSKSVSEINRSLDDGEFDISELESITGELENVNPDELNSVQKKTKEALDIREKQKDIEKAIDKSNASEQTKEDAKKLLNNSKQQAESLEELLDLDSEAFLDSSTLLDEVSTEEFSPEELEELLAFRADQARGLLQEAILEEENVARELANMPIEEALEEVFTETTGKDQVSTVEPINKKEITKNPLYEAFKEELDSEYGDSLRTLLQQIQTMAEQGFSNKEIFETLKNSSIYNFKIPKEIRYKIDSYINSSLLNNINKEDTIEDKTSEENIDDVIDTSDESLLNNQKHKEDDTSTLRIGGILQAWLSPYTQYYRYAQKGDRKPFIDYAKESGKYTEAELKRIEAIYNYFTNHNVFSNINNGAIKVGDKVTFFTDETLNNDAEDFVILMKSNGIVVGALPPVKLAPNYIGLSDFIAEFKEAYEASNKGLEFTYGESEVMQNMVGRVPYDMEGLPLNPLNTIYQGNNFTLGVSRSDGKNAKISIKAGRTRSFIPKASDPESRVLSPLDAKKGQPYLMIESSDPKRQYIPIPFIMPKYSIENTNSLLGQAINSVLEKLRTAKSSDTLKIKQELQELLSISEIYLEIKDGNILMRIKPIGASKYTTILNSPQSEENIVEYAKKGLYGQPFQVSVKYINSTYKGQSYNNMIGEIAKTNLPVGEHHTIDDWFTIRPVGKKGVPIRTTKNNPNKAKPILHEVTIGKDTYKVNLNTFDAYKLNDKGSYDLITDSSADVAKAVAYGYKTSTTEDVYKTEWGLFDSKSEKFVKEEIKETIPVENNTQDLDDNISNQLSLLEQAKNAKLLTTEKKKRAWEALNDNYKQKLLGYTGLKQKQMMEGLERAYKVKTNDFDLSKLKGSLDSYFETPLYRKEETPEELVSVDKEIKWLNAVLPQLATEDKLRLVDGLIKISKEDGGSFAWGQFKQGIITLPKITAKGTVYHEAFHAVVHTLLTDSEVNRLFEAAKDKYGNLDIISLEENLAEDFRRYIQLNELDYNKTKLQRFIDNIFRTIKNIINKIRGKESYIDNLFYRINNGNLSKRNSTDINTFEGTLYLKSSNANYTISDVQSTVDTRVNNSMVNKTREGKNTAWRKVKDDFERRGYIVKGYWNDTTKKWTVASVRPLNNENNQKAHYRKVDQHYRDKYNLSNLSNEDLQYLHDRNLPLSEYNRMSSFEKEVLFHCK